MRATKEPGAPIGRRLFLGIVGLGAIGVAVGAWVQRIEGRVTSAISSKTGGFGSLLPGANEFRLYTVTGGFPLIKDADYRLEVGGLVMHPRTLTLRDLKALPPTKLTKDFQCVTGWRVPNVHWVGVRLGDLLDLVHPKTEAGGVEFYSYDGVYSESLTIAEARRSDVIIAYEMLGAPITAVHGGPVRLYVAPMYGYKSAKWLKSISLVPHPIPGFWEQNGYDMEGWIGKSNGRSDKPVDGE